MDKTSCGSSESTLLSLSQTQLEKKSKSRSKEEESTTESTAESCSSFNSQTFKQPSNKWRECFNNFNLIGKTFELRANRKCVELDEHVTDQQLNRYLKLGVRCFIVDFFKGDEASNVSRVRRLRAQEAQIGELSDLPIYSTVIAKLSPRLHYTGQLEQPNAVYQLIKGQHLTLTTSRHYSMRSTPSMVYVNAGSLLPIIKPLDVVLLGQSIQFWVKSIECRCIKGEIMQGGPLKSHMPVRFPAKRVDYMRLSYEEIRDICMANELGIGIIVVAPYGNKKYVQNIREALDLFDIGHMQLYTVIKPTEIANVLGAYDWLLNAYDGFIIQYETSSKSVSPQSPELLMLNFGASKLLAAIFESRMPILIDPMPFVERKLVPRSEHSRHVYIEPDKFIVSSSNFEKLHGFDILAEHFMHSATLADFSRPYCDKSNTGIDTLLHSLAGTALELSPAAIIVHSEIPTAVKSLSNFRINFPIILVTPILCIRYFIPVHFNVMLLHYPFEKPKVKHDSPEAYDYEQHILQGKNEHSVRCLPEIPEEPAVFYPSYHQRVVKSMAYALNYLRKLDLVSEHSKTLLVYGMQSAVKFPDKYTVYQYSARDSERDLGVKLFDCPCIRTDVLCNEIYAEPSESDEKEINNKSMKKKT